MDTAGSSQIPENRGLDEFATEAEAATLPRPAVAADIPHPDTAWRARLVQSAGTTLGYFWTVVAWMALRCDSLCYRAARLTQRRRVSAPRTMAAGPRGRTIPAAAAAEIDELELEGSYIAAALALAVVAYGALLLMSWREPIRESPESVTPPVALTAPAPGAESDAVTTDASAAPLAVNVTDTIVPAGSSAPHGAAVPERRVSAASLRAMWNRSDTRSLQRALANLRYQTLAFHRCGMEMTTTDEAVARCAGSSRTTYTLYFRRTSGRWVIQRVSSR